MHEADSGSANVECPVAGILVGGIMLLVGTPLTLVFLDRLFDPGAAPEELGSTAAQLAISLAILIGGLACATWRRRVSVDGSTRSVTWSKHVFGMRVSSAIYAAPDIVAIVVRTNPGSYRSDMRLFDVELVGNRGRRPMRLSADSVAAPKAARDWADRLGVPFRDERDGAADKVPAHAHEKRSSRARGRPPLSTEPRAAANTASSQAGPRAKKRPSLFRDLLGLFLAGCIITFVAWLRLGTGAILPAISLSVFLALLVLAARYADSVSGIVKPPDYTPRAYDLLAVIWLLAFPFGPFFGFFATEQLTAGNWQTVAGIRAFLCVVLPLIGVLPLLRFIPGPRALAKCIILLIGTGFPVVQGLTASFDFVYGPVWENVDIVDVRRMDYLFRGHRVRPNIRFVDLSDGRTLRTVETSDPAVHLGAMRLLVLRGLDRVLDAK